jgi:hypothetical protein
MQKTFCTRLMLAVLLTTGTVQMQAECDYFDAFREAGVHTFSVHGAFRDMVLKTYLHEFIKEQLPNSPFFKVGEQQFDLQDIFTALSDALADIADAHFMGNTVDTHEVVRHAFVGSAVHKLWIALLDVIGVSKHISDDVKKQYKRYGKAWFSKAFAISVDKAIAHVQK